MTSQRHASGRVLMIVENNSYPGDPRVRGEAEALRSAGYQVCVIGPVKGAQALCEEVNGIKVYRYPAPPDAHGALGYVVEYIYSMMAILCITLWVLLREGFDVIHAANPPDTLIFIGLFYKCLGKRFVYDHHDLAPEMYYARFAGRGSAMVYSLLLWCERVSCRLADHVITTNESHRAIEMQRDGVDRERITIVRNGPDLSRVRIGDADPALRQRAGMILGYAGVVGIQDGVDLLLRSLYHLIHDLRKTDLLCVIIGDGEALPMVKGLVRELYLHDHVWCTGWIDDSTSYMRYLSTADICLDPSPSSAYNDRCTTIKLMEYMAAGKPIVAFDLPENRFTAQSAALYARPNDEAEFARCIAMLQDDPLLRQTMGAFGRRRVESELSWVQSVPKLLNVYKRVLPDQLAIPSNALTRSAK
jgi:glycosyltransferase involved in cell wall biosynthesis